MSRVFRGILAHFRVIRGKWCERGIRWGWVGHSSAMPSVYEIIRLNTLAFQRIIASRGEEVDASIPFRRRGVNRAL